MHVSYIEVVEESQLTSGGLLISATELEKLVLWTWLLLRVKRSY